MSWLKKEARWKLQKASYRETTEPLNNPGCGWYQIYSFAAENPVDTEELKWCICKEETLVLTLIDIGAYAGQSLPKEALANIGTILSFFADQEKDIILRITYDREGKGLEREPTAIAMVQQHMEQLGSVFVEYRKHIFMMQGLFVGNWGEMHGSRFLSDEKMRKLFDTLWEASGGNFYLAVRRPVQWRILFEKSRNNNQSQKTGLFNDGMFASETDLGTFGELSETSWDKPWRREEELDFTGQLGSRVPFGGEVVGTAGYSNLPAAVTDMRRMHVSYLNRIHDAQVLDKWKQSIWDSYDIYQGMGGYDYVERHLGYRFVVRDVNLIKRGSGRLQIIIENVGFANVYEETDCQLIFVSEDGEKIQQQIQEDPRTWKSAESTTIQLELRDIQLGSYQVYLQLSRRKDGRIIRFANEDAKQQVSLGLLSNF
jgi:hypothetical protein